MSTGITYRQGDSAWSNCAGRGMSCRNNGCGPVSIAMIIANSINPKTTPIQTWNYMYSKGYVTPSGSTWAGMTATLQHFGISCINIMSPKASDIWKHMEKGNNFSILLFKPGTQGKVRWTNGGHYVASTGYKTDKGKHYFYTRDPGTIFKNDGWFCYEETMSNLLVGIWICTSKEYADKFKTNAEPGSSTTSSDTTTPASSITFSDNGQNIVLETQISKLYSSDNYEFVKQEKKESKPTTATEIFKQLWGNKKTQPTESDAETLSELGKWIAPKTLSVLLDELVTGALSKVTSKNPPKQLVRGQLLSYPTIVEAPVIVLNLNGVTIGGYGNLGDMYPNYITSMTVNKTSGKINQYTIHLSYTVRYGEDPNFIDKLLSRTGFTNKIQILYGDSNGSKLYRDDEAIITGVTFNESVSSKTINYTINAVSSIISASSMVTNYASQTAKPSTLVNDLFYSINETSQTLIQALPGMAIKSLVNSKGLIPTNDEVVTTQTRMNTSPISQLEYYVSGMYNSLNNSIYQLNYMDDTNNEFGGPYIKITEVGETDTSTLDGNYFEVDVGYPGENFVMNFSLNNDVYFPLVYKYNDGFSQWNYDIDNAGNLLRNYTNPLMTNNPFHKRNVVQSVWWNKVTEYPISAQLTIKGLLKPIMLGSYIKVNVLFYGSQDLASGVYTVTGQEDSISGSGYTTTLSLLRVGDR